MYVGKLVERAPTERLYANPMHPYTSALISAVPELDPLQVWPKETLPQEVADPSQEIRGCVFAPRCRYSIGRCHIQQPELREVSSDAQAVHWVACHRAEELQLAGAT